MERQQPEPGAIAPGHRPTAATDPQGIQPFALRSPTGLNQLPAQPLAALQLLPAHGVEQAKRLEHCPGIWLVEGQQIGLKFRVVEVKLNHWLCQSPTFGRGPGEMLLQRF